MGGKRKGFVEYKSTIIIGETLKIEDVYIREFETFIEHFDGGSGLLPKIEFLNILDIDGNFEELFRGENKETIEVIITDKGMKSVMGNRYKFKPMEVKVTEGVIGINTRTRNTCKGADEVTGILDGGVKSKFKKGNLVNRYF